MFKSRFLKFHKDIFSIKIKKIRYIGVLNLNIKTSGVYKGSINYKKKSPLEKSLFLLRVEENSKKYKKNTK